MQNTDITRKESPKENSKVFVKNQVSFIFGREKYEAKRNCDKFRPKDLNRKTVLSSQENLSYSMYILSCLCDGESDKWRLIGFVETVALHILIFIESSLF